MGLLWQRKTLMIFDAVVLVYVGCVVSVCVCVCVICEVRRREREYNHSNRRRTCGWKSFETTANCILKKQKKKLERDATRFGFHIDVFSFVFVVVLSME